MECISKRYARFMAPYTWTWRKEGDGVNAGGMVVTDVSSGYVIETWSGGDDACRRCDSAASGDRGDDDVGDIDDGANDGGSKEKAWSTMLSMRRAGGMIGEPLHSGLGAVVPLIGAGLD